MPGARGGASHESPPPVSIAPLTLRFSDAALERAYLVDDFRATKVFVPLVSFVVCALSLSLVTAMPAAFAGWSFIWPTFVVIGTARLAVQGVADEAAALQLYCSTWVVATAGMFVGWVYEQQRHELVTGMSVGFAIAVSLLLVLVSAYLRLLIGAFWPRMLTLLCYLMGWGCTWPRISVLGSPLEPLLLCSALVLGHALSHAMEKAKRRAFLRSQGRELFDASLPRQPNESGPAGKDVASEATRRRTAALAARSPGPLCVMHSVTLEFSDSAIELDFLLRDFRQSHALVSAFCLSVIVLQLLFFLAFPSAWPATFFTLPQFGIIGGVRLWAARLEDEERGMRLFCWTWLGVGVGVFSTWVLAQRRYVLLAALSVPCAYFIAALLAVVSGFLVLLVGPVRQSLWLEPQTRERLS